MRRTVTSVLDSTGAYTSSLCSGRCLKTSACKRQSKDECTHKICYHRYRLPLTLLLTQSPCVGSLHLSPCAAIFSALAFCHTLARAPGALSSYAQRQSVDMEGNKRAIPDLGAEGSREVVNWATSMATCMPNPACPLSPKHDAATLCCLSWPTSYIVSGGGEAGTSRRLG